MTADGSPPPEDPAGGYGPREEGFGPHGPPSGYGPPGDSGPPGPYGPASGYGMPTPFPGPQPPPETQRFSKRFVVLGVLAGIVGAPIVLALLGQLLALVSDTLQLLTFSSMLLVPVAGIVLAAVPGPPWRRGFGLGLVIGPVLAFIVLAGLCVALIAAYSASAGPS